MRRREEIESIWKNGPVWRRCIVKEAASSFDRYAVRVFPMELPGDPPLGRPDVWLEFRLPDPPGDGDVNDGGPVPLLADTIEVNRTLVQWAHASHMSSAMPDSEGILRPHFVASYFVPRQSGLWRRAR